MVNDNLLLNEEITESESRGKFRFQMESIYCVQEIYSVYRLCRCGLTENQIPSVCDIVQ